CIGVRKSSFYFRQGIRTHEHVVEFFFSDIQTKLLVFLVQNGVVFKLLPYLLADILGKHSIYRISLAFVSFFGLCHLFLEISIIEFSPVHCTDDSGGSARETPAADGSIHQEKSDQTHRNQNK